MVRTGLLRRRMDALRRRLPGADATDSASVDDAWESLERTVDRYLAAREAGGATADRLMGSLDVVPQGIVLADATGAIVFRNQAAAGFFSARHANALVESAIGQLIAQAVDGQTVTRTLELFGPPRRALQLRAVPLIGTDVDAGGAFLLIEDVSERHRLDAVRRDFVANISHELKTPVGALGVLAEALSEETDPDVVQRLAGRMQREAFRVARTIDDLLQLSQIEASELPSREPIPVHLVIAEAIDRARHAADIAEVTIEVSEPSRRLAVLGDRRQLVSAVANLCDNAVKYSDRGGAVRLTTRTDGQWVDIDIADEGIGIPAADLERIFERFYRVDRARSRDTGGTGLGLAIVRHVVQNHDGEISVVSREGEGTTFTLRLPSGSGPVSVTPPQEATA